MATALETDASPPTSSPTNGASRTGRTAGAEPDKPSTRKKIILPIVGVLALILLFWAF